jgi:peroxiredoxin
MNNMFSGTGYKVKNATTGPVAWTKEQFNVYSGLSLNSQNHTLGSRSKQYTSTVHDAVYKSAALSGLDAELVSLIVGLPTTLLQIT